MTPKQLFLIVFAHRYVAAAMFVLVVISGSIFTLLTPKSYIASTDLLADSRVDPIAGAAALGSPNYLATQVAILQSDRVADRKSVV